MHHIQIRMASQYSSTMALGEHMAVAALYDDDIVWLLERL